MKAQNLSSTQEYIWLDQRLNESSPKYNIGGFTRVHASLNIDCFKNAVKHLLEQNDVFSFCFIEENGIPYITLSEVGIAQLQWLELDSEKEALEHISADFKQPFSLDSTTPLWTMKLIKISESSYIWYTKFHHMIGDGFSFKLLFEKVSNYYEKLQKGNELIGDQKASYLDYIDWEKAYRNSDDFKADKEFWRSKFQNETPDQIFAKNKQTPNIEKLGFDLTSEQVDQINEFAQELGVSSYHVYLGTFAYLLGKYFYKESVSIGVPVLNRTNAKQKKTIGAFMNVVPVCIKLNEVETIGEFFKAVKKEVLSIYRHQRFQYADLLREVKNADKLYDVRFSFLSLAYQNGLGKNSQDLIMLSNESDDDPISIQVLTDNNNTVKLRFDINTTYISTENANELIKSFQNSLVHSKVIAGSEDKFPICSDEQQQNVLNLSNGVEKNYPFGTFLELWKKSATDFAENFCLRFFDKQLNYQKVDSRANSLANYLIEKENVRKGDRIAIALDRSEKSIITILGILKAGAVFVPIDNQYPIERQRYMLKDSGAQLLIVENQEQETLFNGHKCLEFEQCSFKSSYTEKEVSPADEAYVIYTSGSTGKPKGVVITHASLLDYVMTFTNHFLLTAKDRVLQQASLSFDTSIEEVFPILAAGGELIIGGDNKDFDQLLKLCESAEVTVLSTNPYLLDFLNNSWPTYKLKLRILISGGDVLKVNQVNNLFSKFEVYNTYGPTESTVCATYYKVKGNEDVIPIGNPISNRKIRLTNGEMLLPKGAIGEILIAGKGLAKEYINLPNATKESFVEIEGEQWYKTGDLGRWNEDGNLIFLGRKDYQISYRGYRIEPEEVEIAVQNLLPAAVSVLVRLKMIQAQPVLVAYVEGVFQSDFNVNVIRTELAGIIPKHCIPDYFIAIETWPLLPNGKVDYKALPNPNVKNENSVFSPANTITEKMVAEIWGSILDLDKVDVESDFFHMGGHSLLANQVIVLIRKKANLNLSLSDFFSNPTVRSLAQHLDAKKTTVESIKKAVEKEKYEVSSGQERLWIMSQVKDANAALNISVEVDLIGLVDVERFSKSLNYCIEKHNSLRTFFSQDAKGKIWQHIRPVNFKEANLEQIVLDADASDNLAQLSETFFDQVFDLNQDKLFKVQLIQLEKNVKYRLNILIHHIISDGWSMEVLLKDLMAFYQLESTTELPFQYTDFSEWQNKSQNDIRIEESKKYWITQLSGTLPVFEFPSFKTRPQLKNYTVGSIHHSFSNGFLQKLEASAAQSGTTAFMNIMAGLNALLYRYSGQEDIIIGTPIAGREIEGTENQIGLYLNTLPIRTKVVGSSAYTDLLQAQKTQLLGAYKNQNVAFSDILAEIDLERDISRSALFDVMAVYQSQQVDYSEIFSNEELTIQPVKEYRKKKGQFDLNFSFYPDLGELKLELDYNSDIYSADQLKEFVLHFERLLTLAVDNSETELKTFNFLTDFERQELVGGMANESNVKLTSNSIVDRFLLSATEHPERVALLHEKEQLTYDQLSVKSAKLANYLTSNCGVKKGDLVGIYLNRDTRLIIAMLSVLRSGGAYVPLDVNYPEERTQYILTDSKAKLVIDENFWNDFEQYTNELDKPLNFETDLTKHDDAYVIYTSGSTGKPKGVRINHGNVNSFVEWASNAYANTNFETVYAGTSICFDLSIFEIFYSLSAGKSIRILENGLEIPSFISSDENILINTVPSVMTTLLGAEIDLSNVTAINFAGEPIPKACLKQLDLDKIEVRNLYGPSESTTYSTCFKINNADDVSIGRPIEGTNIYILDQNQNLLPKGSIGEICISGLGVSPGYLNRPTYTNECFIDNPFQGGEKIYKTGDLGRWLPNGELDFIGRNDFQVKLRGYRIELREIEEVLQDIPKIIEAAVSVNESDNEKILVAHVLSEEILDEEDILAELEKSLPRYMLPNILQQVKSFPRTLNGKIDRKQLAFDSRKVHKVTFVPPQNRLEEQVAESWSEILKVEKIGSKDDFFRLGGHSLKLVRLLAVYAEKFGVKLNFQDLFKASTVAEHSLLLSNAQKVTFCPIEKTNWSETYPVSDAQRRLWILSQFERANISYNLPYSMSFDFPFDYQKLKLALCKLTDRHEILRTHFLVLESGEIHQKIVDSSNFNFELVHIDLRTADNPEKEVDAYIKKDEVLPFDLEKGPLFRLAIFSVKNGENILYCNMHHIISDGWSISIMLNDLTALYQAELNNEAPLLNPLKIQYKDYAIWQLNRLDSGDFDSAKQFWLNNLSGDIPVLEFPFQKQRTKERTGLGGILKLALSKELTNKIVDFGQNREGTIFMSLVAALNVHLHKYTGNTDLIIGAPVSGREHVNLHDQIGFYVNTVVLRNTISANQGFEAFFEQVKENSLQAFSHQDYPFNRLIDELGLKYELGQNPLFNIMVSYDEAENGSNNADALTLEDGIIYKEENRFNKFDLDVSFKIVNGNVQITIDYAEDIFSADFIERLLINFNQLIAQLFENPKSAISEIELLSNSGKQTILDFNIGQKENQTSNSVIEMFERQVHKFKHENAIEFGEDVLSYEELNKEMNQLANWLIAEYNIAAEDVVGIELEKGIDVIIALLAVLKSGAAYLPIDLSNPKDRIDFIKSDSNCKLIIDEEILIKYKQIQNQFADVNPVVQYNTHDLAYIIYTSGSTGKPKGVMIEQGSLVTKLNEELNLVAEIAAPIKTCFNTNFAFDVSLLEIFLPLVSGGTLVIPQQDQLLSQHEFAKLIIDKKVNLLQGTPGFIRSFLLTNSNKELNQINSVLQLICIGGEALPQALVNDLKTNLPDVQLNNHYGPTETTIDALVLQNVKQGDEILIGKGLNSTPIYVLNETDKLQPIGVVGEICIGGAGVARGYLNREELTKQQFVTLSEFGGERVYKTGDLGYWTSDGKIAFCGRKDDQVKIRGYRIELGEIETALIQLPEVENAVVLSVAASDEINELVAYLQTEVSIDLLQLKNSLKGTLPAYMIPSSYCILDKIPYTKNGKVDKKGLLKLNPVLLKNEFVKPANELEEQVHEIWQEVLIVQQIGVTDDFFGIGGHSLNAMKLIAAYSKQFDAKLNVKDIFTSPTIREQGKLIEKADQTKFESIQLLEKQDSYPVSDAQKRLWVLSQFEGDNAAYNMPASIRLDKTYNKDVLIKAINQVINRHEVLRTVFHSEKDEIRQVIVPFEEFDFSVNEVNLLGHASPEKEAENRIEADAFAPFDLRNGPLMRATLYDISEKGYLLYFNMHHIITDAWSMEVLSRDVFSIYDSLIQNKKPDLKELNIQYKDYAVWQLNQFQRSEYLDLESYWLDKLKGDLPRIDLKFGVQRPIVKTNNGRTLKTYLSKSFTSDLNAWLRENSGSLFMGLTTILEALVYQYTKQEDLIIGTPIAGRYHADLEDQMGFYANTLVLRNNCSSERSFKTLFQEVSEMVLDAYEHEAYPFDRLVEKLNQRRDTSRNAIFDIMIVLQNIKESNNDTTGTVSDQDIIDLGTCQSKFDMLLNFEEEGGHLCLTLEYNEDIYDIDFVTAFMSHFKVLGRNLLNNPDLSIGEQNYLSQSEINDIANYSAGPNAVLSSSNVIELLEKSWTANASKKALVFEEVQLSYAQLNQTVNNLANRLTHEFSIKTGDRVAVKLQRSEKSVIAFLATLKIGASYLPIDDQYPEERVTYILNDALPKVVISDTDLNLDSHDSLLFKFTDLNLNDDGILNTANINYSNEAFVIYTSGSTGQPKGVVQTHKMLNNLTNWENGFSGINRDAKHLQFVSFGFDVSVQDCLAVLTSGGELHVASDKCRTDFTQLRDYILKHEIEVLCFPFAALSGFFTAIGAQGFLGHSIQQIICSGEQLKLNKELRRFLESNKVELHNHYGPSESHVVSHHILSSELNNLVDRSPIGKPINNTQLLLLDKNHLPVSFNQPGEVFIGGANLAMGYLNQPDLTQSKFIALKTNPSRAVYATGDIAQMDKNGIYTYLGRKDKQTKIRGYRVEPEDVEKAITSIELVQEVVVVVKEKDAENYLCAFVVLKDEITTQDIRRELATKLPSYLIPAIIYRMESFPLTANGKVDKKLLKELTLNQTIDITNYVTPETNLEKEVAAIWSRILEVEKVGLNDDFFELGGHSLKAMRLIAEYHKQLHIKLELKDIFVNSQLVQQVDLLANKEKQVFQPIVKTPEANFYPLSPSQQRLWMIDKMKIENSETSYNMFGSYLLPDDLNLVNFEKAINGVIARHEILRTIFVNQEGTGFQRILSPESVTLQVPLVNANFDETEVSENQFDLEKWPLIKAVIVEEEKRRLLFCIHHIISDGWSMELFIRDLLALYESMVEDTAVSLPALSIQYKDYAVWQNKQLSNGHLSTSQAYWQNQLGGRLPQLRLPEDYATSRPSLDGSSYELFIDQELKTRIEAFIQGEKVSLFSLLMSSFKVMLHRLTAEEDLIVGTPVANRSHESVKDLIGFFLNTLMIRNKVDSEEAFRSFLQQVNQTLMTGLEHQSYPFENLLDDLDVVRDYNRFPISSVFLNMIDFNNTEKVTINELAPKHEQSSTAVKFDMECYFKSYSNAISIYCIYKKDLFKADTIAYWMNNFLSVIDQVVTNPDLALKSIAQFDSPLNKLDYPKPAQGHTFFAKEKETTLVARFEKQAEQYANNPAIVSSTKTLTYQELNAYGNGVAHLIQEQEQSSAPIALLAEHGWLTVGSMLGALKSGHSYLPLDPSFPEDRLKYMLEDTNSKLLLATPATLELANRLKDDTVQVILLNESIQSKEENPKNELTGESPAYILYTSGSTGKPKGVVQNHKNVLHFISVYTNGLHLTPEDRLSLLPTYGFDAAVMDIYGGLLNGSALYPYHVKTEGLKGLNSWLEEEQITVLHMVPTLYRYFLEDRASNEQLKDIRLVVLGGEAVYQSDFELFKTHFTPGCIFINGYGPTESTITLQNYMNHSSEVDNQKINIGYPVADTTVYVLDEDDKPLGIYQEGELVYKSNHLAVGYHNKADQTAIAFTNDPVTGEGRVYRSGDLGRLLPSGEVEFTGRKDSQVKLNGQRIELSEIEQALLKINAVEEAIVLMKSDGEVDRLVSYIKTETKEAELRQALSLALPMYMVPTIYVYVDVFPLTPTGKISRRDLPEPDFTEIVTAEYVAPRNEVEQQLVTIIAKVLQLEPSKIGIDANFFELGGNSIKLFQILNEINEKTELNLKIMMLFQFSTVRTLLNHLFEDDSLANQDVNIEKEEEFWDEDLSEELDEMIDFMDD